ncbi:MAG: hypothetical protein LUK37_10130 [Clostridia bacterium]|nr:hypothetical protein [Clostridia bacterium]
MNSNNKGNIILMLLIIGGGGYIAAQLLRLQCFHIYNIINSDMSSEMVLAKQLAEEGKWMLSDNWYYSTELRVVNTQLISAFIFRFTDNWQLVRALTAIILYLICGGAVAFLGKSLKWRGWTIFLCELLMLIPYSGEYLNIVQFSCFYYPHIILMFFALGVFFYSEKKMVCVLYWLIISFLMGLGGLRYLLILHIPAACAGLSLLIKEKESYDFLSYPTKGNIEKILGLNEAHHVAVIISGGVMAGVGYIVMEKLLRKRFIFQSFYDLSYLNFGEKGESVFGIFGKVIMGIPEIMGFKYDVRLMSAQGLLNVLILFLVLVILICVSVQVKRVFFNKDRLGSSKRNNYTSDFILLQFLFSFLANLFIFVFAGNYTSRYWILVLIWLIPLLAGFMNGIERASNLFRLYIISIIVYALVNGAVVLNDAIKHNNSENRNAVNQYLMDQNINVGYSTFWNANVTTEMTNGEIKILPINSESDLVIYKWLTPRDFYYDDRQIDELSFILLSRQEAEQVQDIPLYQNGQIGYMDSSFVVYVFKRNYLESQIIY